MDLVEVAIDRLGVTELPSQIPRLSLDLEREIFEMTAILYPSSATRLVLVARRVQEWIEKFIYEVVLLPLLGMLKCANFLRTLDSERANLLTSNVKSLCLPVNVKWTSAKKIIDACQGIVDLACWITDEKLPDGVSDAFSIVSSLRPRRFSVNFLGFPLYSPDFTHPFYSNITHLDISDSCRRWSAWPTFGILSRLTHLALYLDSYQDWDAGILPRLRSVLTACMSLIVFIVFISDYGKTPRMLSFDGIDDPRLVVLSNSDPIGNWEASVRGNACRWSIGEGIVAERVQRKSMETF